MVNKKNTSGFTLMELMVVIAIIAIISGIAIPNFLSMLPKSRLRSATRDIVSCLQEMKLRAIRENATTVVIFNLANDEYTAFVDNGPGAATGNWALDATDTIIKRIVLPPDIDLYDSGFTLSPNTFGYDDRGLPGNNSFGSVSLTYNNKDYRKVTVNFAGNIRVQKSTDGVNWD